MSFASAATQAVATEYNGWTNRETWMVNMWLTSEESYYHELQDIIHEFDEGHEQAEELEQACRFVIERHDDTGPRGDLIDLVLGKVNW